MLIEINSIKELENKTEKNLIESREKKTWKIWLKKLKNEYIKSKIQWEKGGKKSKQRKITYVL